MLRFRRWWIAFVTLWCLGAVIDLVHAADARLQPQPTYPPPQPTDLPPWIFLVLALVTPIAIAALAFIVDSLARANRQRRQRLTEDATDARALVSTSVAARPS